MKYQLFVRWNMETQEGKSCLVPHEGYDAVELVRPNGSVVSSHVFCNNRERVYGYCVGVVEAFKLLELEIDPLAKKGRRLNLEMPHCLDGRPGVSCHLTSDTSRQD